MGPRFGKRNGGSTWRPAPGSGTDKVPVEMEQAGGHGAAHDKDGAETQDKVPTEEGVDRRIHAKRSNITDIRVTRKYLANYGTTPGCPACKCYLGGKKTPPGTPHTWSMSQKCPGQHPSRRRRAG